jgi:hypothetical protein
MMNENNVVSKVISVKYESLSIVLIMDQLRNFVERYYNMS